MVLSRPTHLLAHILASSSLLLSLTACADTGRASEDPASASSEATNSANNASKTEAIVDIPDLSIDGGGSAGKREDDVLDLRAKLEPLANEHGFAGISVDLVSAMAIVRWSGERPTSVESIDHQRIGRFAVSVEDGFYSIDRLRGAAARLVEASTAGDIPLLQSITLGERSSGLEVRLRNPDDRPLEAQDLLRELMEIADLPVIFADLPG